MDMSQAKTNVRNGRETLARALTDVCWIALRETGFTSNKLEERLLELFSELIALR